MTAEKTEAGKNPAERRGLFTPAARINAGNPWGLLLCVLLLTLTIAGGPGRLAGSENTAKYAGTYRIKDWESLQSKQIYHFVYLHPDGVFILAAEWPGNESSRFYGEWTVSGNMLYMSGNGVVKSNQGNWNTEYGRSFRIVLDGTQVKLDPVPEKNRFGLMGWPTPFLFHRAKPEINLPAKEFPATEPDLLTWIRQNLTPP
ncbi:MAG: hypothetical protein OEZ59_07470 [Deltaproteobacteria bacterium]|nr:hypothetical protein [Deltaproteobacteria bacterium]